MGHRHGPAASGAATPRLTVRDVVRKSTEYLASKGVETPRLDAELLLAHVFGVDRLRLFMDWDKPLTDLELTAYRESIRRRGQEREPVARIVGRREFYKLPFAVTKDVFSPRPETEGLVDRVLDFLKLREVAGETDPPTILEVGTGSGAISVALAANYPNGRFIATEASEAAFAVAKRNAETNGVAARISFRQGRDLAGYDGPLTVLVSNPPYVRTGEIETLPPEVRTWDPRMALDGGPDGLAVVRTLAEEAVRLLVPGGGVFLELGQDQRSDALGIFRASGAFSEVAMERDFAGLDRYLVARKLGGWLMRERVELAHGPIRNVEG